MDDVSLNNKIVNAAKWSTITEIIAKVIMPITNIILARILAPEAFGVIATITMIISFVEIFTDAGFQKYLIQKNFKTKEELHNYANVAFWSNLFISLLILILIVFFSQSIAKLVGNPGLGNVISVACLQLPITAFSSIQNALYKRDFNFKTLFVVRMYYIFIPIVVTIPLAFLGFGYWALIIGTISMQLSNATILTIKSHWRPGSFFSWNIFKKMFSFSSWSLIEALSIWLTTWVDAFIIGSVLNEYYLGLYKTSTIMVNSLMALITASIVPVLFSALSRLQNDNEKFNLIYFKAQRLVGLIVLPIGMGVFLYSDIITQLMLGKGWAEAGPLIGIWALTSSIMILFSHFSSEVYRAKGKPKLSFFAQLLHLVVLVPVCLISSKYGFWNLVYARSLIRLQFILIHLLFLKYFIGIPLLRMINNLLLPLLVALVLGVTGYVFKKGFHNTWGEIPSIILSIIIYVILIVSIRNIRKEFSLIGKRLRYKLQK